MMYTCKKCGMPFDYSLVFNKINELKNRTELLTDRHYYNGANDALDKLENELKAEIEKELNLWKG